MGKASLIRPEVIFFSVRKETREGIIIPYVPFHL
jgi:hypothetical protein